MGGWVWVGRRVCMGVSGCCVLLPYYHHDDETRAFLYDARRSEIVVDMSFIVHTEKALEKLARQPLLATRLCLLSTTTTTATTTTTTTSNTTTTTTTTT